MLGTLLSASSRHRPAGRECLLTVGGPALQLAVGVAAAGSIAEPLAAQAECLDCRIRIDSLAVFGSIADPFSPSPRSDVAGDGQTFLVGPLDGMPDAVAVYSLDGERRVLASSGDGPGEFRDVRQVEQKDGRYHVFSRGRETVFDSTLELVETHNRVTPGIIDAVAVSPSTSVVEYRGYSDEGPAILLSLRRGSGESAFGSGVELPLRTANSLGSVKLLGQGNGETFWTAFNNRYEFRRWSPARVAPLHVLRPQDRWFPETPREPERRIDPFQAPPPSVLAAIREDADGRLWVASIHPREDWAPRDVDGVERVALYPTIVYSIVDVIDAQTGVSLARVRLEGMVVSFPTEGVVATRQAGQLGLTTLHIIRLQLEAEGA